MKPKVQTTHTKRTGRFVAFAAIIGLGLSAMFVSPASAVMDTDPVIVVEGTCDLFGPETASGIWMSLTNDDGWDEDYAIGVFEGKHAYDGEPLEEEPLEVLFIEVEAGGTEWGPFFVDSMFATIQVMDLSEAIVNELVFHEIVTVCIDSPDFDFDDEEEDSDDDGVEEHDEGEEPVIVEDDGVEEDDEGEEPVIVEDDGVEEDDDPVSVWENITNDISLDTDEGDNIGVPPEPKINPEDTDDTDEAASSEGKETQGSSGLSLLWIILIIVAGLITVGTATRKLQKNNS